MTTLRVAHRRRFTPIDRATINDRTLSFRARGVLVWLLDKPDGWKVDSAAMAAETVEGRDAVRTALMELEQAGYLRRVKMQTRQGHWVTEVLIFEQPPTPENPSSVPGPENQASVSQALVLLPTERDKTPSIPQGGLARAAEFESFWVAYPRKTDKAAARKAWGKLCRDHALPEIPTILDAVRRYAATEAVGRGVTLHPSTWLSRRRWEDDVPDLAVKPGPMLEPACPSCFVVFEGPWSCITPGVCPQLAEEASHG